MPPLEVVGEGFDAFLFKRIAPLLFLAPAFGFLPFPLSLLVLDSFGLDRCRPGRERFEDSVDQGFDPLRLAVSERASEAAIFVASLVQYHPEAPIRRVVPFGRSRRWRPFDELPAVPALLLAPRPLRSGGEFGLCGLVFRSGCLFGDHDI